MMTAMPCTCRGDPTPTSGGGRAGHPPKRAGNTVAMVQRANITSERQRKAPSSSSCGVPRPSRSVGGPCAQATAALALHVRVLCSQTHPCHVVIAPPTPPPWAYKAQVTHTSAKGLCVNTPPPYISTSTLKRAGSFCRVVAQDFSPAALAPLFSSPPGQDMENAKSDRATPAACAAALF